MVTTVTNTFFTLLMLFSFGKSFSQGGIWTWVKGSSSPSAPVVYGTQGIVDPTNTPPALYQAAHWIDQSGNFWIFGGSIGGGDEASDLWKYDPFNNGWTWVKGPGQWQQAGIYGTKGVPNINNNPGARSWGIFTWTDLNNNLWMYGGSGFDDNGNVGVLGDLWKYNIASNTWTWMHGSNTINPSPVYGATGVAAQANTPGARQEGNSTWVDDENNLWLFGGGKLHDVLESCYNDMWKYEIATNRWTHMKGPQVVGNNGNYGIINVEANTNVPPARRCYSTWKDNDGFLYLFGGADHREPLNYADVWKYNLTTNNWTWINGPNTPNTLGNFNAICNAGHPPAKFESNSPKTNVCGNKVAIFGGGKFNSSADHDAANDLWLFDIQTTEWKWISGSSQLNDNGSQGQLGVPSATNVPHARAGACMWMDYDGVLWVFGGQDGSPLLHGARNDMWKFVPNEQCTGKIIGGYAINLSDTIICKGDTVNVYIPDVTIKQIEPAPTSLIIDSTHAILFPNAPTKYTITADNKCAWNDKESITIKIEETTVQYNVSDTVVCPLDTVTLKFIDASIVSVMPLPYILDTPASVFLLTDSTTAYSVITQSHKCGYIDTFQQLVVIRKPEAIFDLLPEQPSLDEPVLQVNNNSQWYTDLYWTVNGDTIQINDNTYTISDTGELCIMLTATQNNKCADTALQCVYIDGKSAIAIPNAFTPNGDGKNDYFTILGNGITAYEIHIYNRWGEQVYYSNDVSEVNSLTKGWDGSYRNNPQPFGTFLYYVTAQTGLGKVFKESKELILIR